MLSYSKIFRPWDECKKPKVIDTQKAIENAKLKRKTDEVKKENRLRKIRSKTKVADQDATISTTTEENHTNNKSHVATLTEYCDRLLEADKEIKNERKELHPTKLKTDINIHPSVTNLYQDIYCPTYVSEFVHPVELTNPLGLHPNDPLLYESIAHGYAMELEYARVLHEENQARLLNKKQRPKKYKCPHCNVGFSNNGQLKGHIRIHTGERPFKCDDKNCGKTFTRNEELTRHKRIHSGVRPYPCSTCGKKFGRRDHLKKHTKTHMVQADRMMPVFLPLSAAAYPYIYGY